MTNADRMDKLFQELQAHTLNVTGAPTYEVACKAVELGRRNRIPDFFTCTPGEADDVWKIPESFVNGHGIPSAPGCDNYYTAYGDLCAGTFKPHKELFIFRELTWTWQPLPTVK